MKRMRTDASGRVSAAARGLAPLKFFSGIYSQSRVSEKV